MGVCVRIEISFFFSGLVGLALAYALSVTGSIGGVLSVMTEVEREMIAVERTQQYIKNIPLENNPRVVQNPPYAWPSQGAISFQAVMLNYR